MYEHERSSTKFFSEAGERIYLIHEGRYYSTEKVLIDRSELGNIPAELSISDGTHVAYKLPKTLQNYRINELGKRLVILDKK